jgi:HAD superfamily hydrolase (TIGR01549 family)
MANSKKAILFDLDETLVLTSALEPLRRLRNWPRVYANFAQTQLPPDTLKFVSDLKTLGDVEIGVVTKAPRPYTQKLLSFHGLDVPVLVAYHDVSRQKPHPEALLKAAAKLDLPVGRCIYIGDHPDDMEAAAAARCAGIGVTWAGECGIAGACESWQAVYDRVVLICEQLNGQDI